MFKNLSLKSFNINTGLRESLRLANLGNFEGIDLNILDVEALCQTHSVNYVKGMLDSFNIKPGVWNLSSDITLTDAGFTANIDKLTSLVEISEKIGANRCVLSLPVGSDTTSCEDFSKMFPERLNVLAKRFNEYNCSIGVEIVGKHKSVKPYQHIYRFTTSQIYSFCKEANITNVGIVLDTFLLDQESNNQDILQQFETKDIISVKASDSDNNKKIRNLPRQTNVIDLPFIMQTLRNIRYNGPITPISDEPRVFSFPNEIAVILAGGYLTRLWKDSFTKTED
ncbi:sugar phosphate isomerase/epimerase [bacterium]|nr:sugar phosphate isomerase/epimerase [bacterium]